MRFNRIFLFLLAISLVSFPFLGCRRASAATKEVESAQKSFIEELTFLGDSTTAHMQSRSPIQKERVWAAKTAILI